MVRLSAFLRWNEKEKDAAVMKRFHFWKKLILVGLAAAILPVCPAVAAEPSFSFKTDRQNASAGDVISLHVAVGPAAGVAGFRLRVAFDSSVLQFAGVSPEAQIEPGTMQTNEEADPVCSVYVCNVDRGFAPALSGTILTYRFLVRGGVTKGTTELCACVDETCDFSGKDMRLDAFQTNTLNLASSAADAGTSLTALEPSEGMLQPSFSPEIHSYRLDVGAAVDSVSFRTEVADGAHVSVSRRTLLAPGSRTPVTVTVTSADGKTRAVYTVMVVRAQKNAGGSVTASQSSGKNEKAEKALAAARNGTQSTGAAGGPAASAAAALQQNLAPLTVVQDRMPVFLTGMLAAGFCIVTGILLSVWFRQKKK